MYFKRCMPKDALFAAMIALCLSLMPSISLGQTSEITESLNEYESLQSDLIHDQQKFSSHQLVHSSPVFFASSDRDLSFLFGDMYSKCATNEEIALDSAHSQKQVNDILAVNSVKQRNIVYDDIQRGDSENSSNFADIRVTGMDQDNRHGKDKYGDLGREIEENVDNRLASSTNGHSQDAALLRSHDDRSNNLNIEVSGVSVSAINTVERGIATATSNIIIKPVQIIVDPSEASEKLK